MATQDLNESQSEVTASDTRKLSDRVEEILIISDAMKPTAASSRRTANETSVSADSSVDKKEPFDDDIDLVKAPSLSSYLSAVRNDASTPQQKLKVEKRNQQRKELAAVLSVGPTKKSSSPNSSDNKSSAKEKRPTIRQAKSMEIECRRNGIPQELSFRRHNMTSHLFRSSSDGHCVDDNNDEPGGEGHKMRQRRSDLSNNSLCLDDVAAVKDFDRSNREGGGGGDSDEKSTDSMPSLVSFLGASTRSQASSAASAISNKSSACSSAGIDADSFSTIPSINTMKTFASSESGTPTVKHRNYIPGVATPKKDKRWECEG